MIDPPSHEDAPEAAPLAAPVGPNAASTGRERYSSWSLVLLFLVVALQVASSAGYDFSWKHTLRLTREKVSGVISSDALQGLIQIDDGAKAVYLQDALTSRLAIASSQAASGGTASQTSAGTKNKHPSPIKPQTLKDRLKPSVAAAVDLLRRNPDNPAMARRVILLRAESGANPFDPIASTPRHPGLADPLETYARAGAGNAIGGPIYRREVALWSALFSRRVTDPREVDSLAQKIDTSPNLRWYKNLALHQLYLRAGETALASAALSRARREAGLSVIPQGLLTVFVIALVLLGVVVLIGIASGLPARLSGNQTRERPLSGTEVTPDETHLFQAFAVPLTPSVASDERRLRPRDLMDAFVVFLLSLNGVSLGAGWLALELLQPRLKTLSPVEINYANILVSAVGYVGGGSLAYLFLRMRARALGASLGAELGLNRRALAANLGFGLVGWGIALLCVVIVSKIAGTALRAAPAPSNPALPLLISAPDIFTQVLLYALVAVAAPFFEELFFRGVLMNALLPRFSPLVSIIITGFLFGMVHPVGIAEVFSLATLGMVMAWAAYTRKSLVPSMTMHWLQNSFAYFTLYFTFLTIAHR